MKSSDGGVGLDLLLLLSKANNLNDNYSLGVGRAFDKIEIYK